MSERGIIMQAESVRAILAGRKTQTRRVYRPRNPEPWELPPGEGYKDDGTPWPMYQDTYGDFHPVRCPYGAPGDRLCYNCGHDTHTSTDSWRDQQRLHGGERRANLQSQKVPGLWTDGDRPLAPAGGKSRKEELLADIHEQRRSAQDSVSSPVGVPRVSRAPEAGSGSSSPGRRPDEQPALESVLGYADRAMAGQAGSWAREDGRESPLREVHGRGARASSVGDSRWAVQQATGSPCPRCGAILRSGDRLWVRERWAHFFKGETPSACVYLANAGTDRWRQAASEDFALNAWKGMWRSPLLMPRWASRITLEITEVRVQRVQEISEDDAMAEGIALSRMHDGLRYAGWGSWVSEAHPSFTKGMEPSARSEFACGWDALNAKRGFPWSANPWVWAVSFRVLAAGAAKENR